MLRDDELRRKHADLPLSHKRAPLWAADIRRDAYSMTGWTITLARLHGEQ